MIDFEQEIEKRLIRFQWLNGKGNVKDCNHTLYEVVRLMLTMITQQKNKIEELGKPPSDFDFLKGMYSQPTVTDTVVTDTPEINNGAIISDTVEEADTDTVEKPPQPSVTPSAPLGLTKFGNPKRDRSNHKKSSSV
jgi:hypothetical protein